MVNVKNKGNGWERDAVTLLNSNLDGNFKRVPGSGAIGTSMKESFLTGDITGVVNFLSRKLKIECKVGYGGATQMTLKKEWLDKIFEEARTALSVPMLMGKFSGARSGVKYFVVFDFDTFVDIFSKAIENKDKLDALYEQLQEIKNEPK